jgi:copper chaperone
MEEMFLRIAGMSCGGCVTSLRNALNRLPGVQVKDVEVGSASIAYDPSLASPEAVRSAVAKAGFQAEVTR